MEKIKFIKLRPYVYHITDEANLISIRKDFTLKSTAFLANHLNIPNKDEFLRTRRIGHRFFNVGGISIAIRDQDPLSEKIASKNLEDGISFADFVFLLNSRVFFWAKEKDMQGHHKRYTNQHEFPIVLKIPTADLFEINQNEPQFCRLNSGAPRCSSYYTEGAPPRGKNTFLPASKYLTNPATVREVTFEESCKLPKTTLIADGPFKKFVPLI